MGRCRSEAQEESLGEAGITHFLRLSLCHLLCPFLRQRRIKRKNRMGEWNGVKRLRKMAWLKYQALLGLLLYLQSITCFHPQSERGTLGCHSFFQPCPHVTLGCLKQCLPRSLILHLLPSLIASSQPRTHPGWPFYYGHTS